MIKKQVVNSKMSIRVQFEIGHTAILKTRKADNIFTHDWELYVKGADKTDISSFVEKIVFNLHESFPKPKRTFKEPPYVLKESGYAGFILPIDIHFKNKTMQTYQYDIDLQPSGPPVHKCEIKKHIFENPSEDFRQKLIRGGGVLLGNGDEDRNRHTENDFQHKIKNPNSGNVGQDSSKKTHKIRQEKSKVQNFENIFGKPITKTTSTPAIINPNNTSLKSSSSSQEQKAKSVNTSTTQNTSASRSSSQNKIDKVGSNVNNSNTKEKMEITDKLERKDKHKHSSHKDKDKVSKEGKERKEEKHEKRDDRDRKKDKSHSKERDRSNEKSSKTRTESPQRKKPRTQSPIGSTTNISRKSPSRIPPVTGKEENKNKSSLQALPTSLQSQPQSHHQNTNQTQTNDSDKKLNNSSVKKSKKEKKSHDKDKERDSRRERENNKSQKDIDQGSRTSSTTNYQGSLSTAAVGPAASSNVEINKIHKQESGSIKPLSKSKAEQKVMSETINYFSNSNTISSTSTSKKGVDKHESEEKRHKHKKKEKSRDKDKEKSKDKEISLKDKDKKRDKKISKDDFKRNKEEDVGSNATSSSNLGPTESLHDSLFNSDHESRYSDTDKVAHHSDNSSHSFVGKLSKNKGFQNNSSNAVHKPFLNTVPVLQSSSNDIVASSVEKKDKKNKDQKVEKEEKKRKRKSRDGADSKVPSSGSTSNNIESQPKISKKGIVDSKKYEKPVSLLPHVIQTSDSFRAPSVSSSSSISNSSVPILQHHTTVSRTNNNSGNVTNPGFDLDYISELKELQEKIMTLQDNNELQKVVEIIAATGRFEITNKTFDFDLCALDRNTIQRLHVIV